jgi:PAS domain S-box-containing protein
MRITTKLTLIISCLLIVLFMTLAWTSYRHDQALALQETVDKARTIARQIVEIREYLSSVVRVEQVEQNTGLTPQVAATRIALRLTQDSPYYVRQVSLRYRNPQNQPDAYERETLQQFKGAQLKERFQVVGDGDNKALRYLLPMVADQSCLTCHGSFEQAPRFVQQRFPKGHPSYNYQAGELIGAISVSVPLSTLQQTILNNMRRELLLEGVIVLLLVVVTGWLIHRTILSPVARVAEGIETAASSGNFSSPIVAANNDEIGRLVNSFNELMAELERRTRQRHESDERYRNFIEIAQSPIVTFLPDGKIVISNQKAEKLFGLSKDELLGQSIFDFFSDPTALREGISDYFHAGSSALIGTTSRQTVRDICGRLFEVEVVISVSQTEQEAMFTAILRTGKEAQ